MGAESATHPLPLQKAPSCFCHLVGELIEEILGQSSDVRLRVDEQHRHLAHLPLHFHHVLQDQVRHHQPRCPPHLLSWVSETRNKSSSQRSRTPLYLKADMKARCKDLLFYSMLFRKQLEGYSDLKTGVRDNGRLVGRFQKATSAPSVHLELIRTR